MLTDLGGAFTAFVGGVLAATIGFNQLIIISVVISVLGVLFLYPIRYYLYK